MLTFDSLSTSVWNLCCITSTGESGVCLREGCVQSVTEWRSCMGVRFLSTGCSLTLVDLFCMSDTCCLDTTEGQNIHILKPEERMQRGLNRLSRLWPYKECRGGASGSSRGRLRHVRKKIKTRPKWAKFPPFPLADNRLLCVCMKLQQTNVRTGSRCLLLS